MRIILILLSLSRALFAEQPNIEEKCQLKGNGVEKPESIRECQCMTANEMLGMLLYNFKRTIEEVNSLDKLKEWYREMHPDL